MLFRKDPWEGGVGPGPGGKEERARRARAMARITGAACALAVFSLALALAVATSSQARVKAVSADAQPTVVALQDIPAGSVVEESMVGIQEIPAGVRASTATGDASLVVGHRTMAAISTGTQVTPELVSGSEGARSLSAALDSGSEAVTISVDAASGLAGLVNQGDRVRVVASAAEGAAVGGEAPLKVETLADEAFVLALDASLSEASDSYASVTVSVTPEEADAIRAAQFSRDLSLVMTSPADSEEER